MISRLALGTVYKESVTYDTHLVGYLNFGLALCFEAFGIDIHELASYLVSPVGYLLCIMVSRPSFDGFHLAFKGGGFHTVFSNVLLINLN